MMKYLRGGNIVQPDSHSELIDRVWQTHCCFGAGILLNLIKCSRHDICNLVREMSKYIWSVRQLGLTMSSSSLLWKKNFGLRIDQILVRKVGICKLTTVTGLDIQKRG
jgi:hypothetical protein